MFNSVRNYFTFSETQDPCGGLFVHKYYHYHHHLLVHSVLKRIKIQLEDRLVNVMWSHVRSLEKGQIYLVNTTLLHYWIKLNALLIQISFSQVRCDGGRQVKVRSANR